MIGLGALINTAAIIIGGLLGLLFSKKMKPKYQHSLTAAIGVCVIFIAIGGVMEKMLLFTDGNFSTQGSMMLIISVALGTFVGELINLEGLIERFAQWLKRKTKSDNDNNFVNAFVTTSLTVCVGAMAIVGSIEDGLSGDYSISAAKSVLDFIMVLIMSASLGKGAVFSAIPVAILQGGVTALARLIKPLVTTAAMNNLSLVGSALIFCVGVNLLWGKKIKVANLLPSLIFAAAFAFLPV